MEIQVTDEQGETDVLVSEHEVPKVKLNQIFSNYDHTFIFFINKMALCGEISSLREKIGRLELDCADVKVCLAIYV